VSPSAAPGTAGCSATPRTGLAELRLTLRDLALDPNTPFDRVDAALVAHRASAGPVSGLATKIKTTTTVRGATGPGDQSRGTAR